MTEKEWLHEIEGYLPGPWRLELNEKPIGIIRFLWYLIRCWYRTPHRMRYTWGIVREDKRDGAIICILGPGPTNEQNGMLISGAPVLVQKIEE